MNSGKVYLIGAGPGDPALVTLRAVECLKLAEVIVYDHLANEAIMEHARPDAERIYAGKKGGCHAMPQEAINQLLVDKARSGKIVARLKGGDPYIFGRGSEEASFLFENGLPFEVVPGITSAAAAPAYAGIPLTDRRYTAAVSLITGHEDPTKSESGINWEKVATATGTLVFLMGVKNLPGIVDNLIKHGRPRETPAAIIQQGTTPSQKTVTGTLADIVELAGMANIKPPSIILVGGVVNLRDKLNWFETRPLFGRRIIVTRAREQASGFLAKLQELGADAIAFPTIETAPPDSWEPLDKAISRLSRYHWIVFTSVNGVIYFHERLYNSGLDARAFAHAKLAAIGPATARALQDRGLKPDLVPEEYRAEAVVEGMKDRLGPGVRILIPRAKKAREVLPLELQKTGAEVDVIPAYQTLLPQDRRPEVEALLKEGKVDLITFTSSSTVTNFAQMFPGRKPAELLKGVTVACIGPITARTARDMGLETHVQPEKYTINGLVEAILAFFGLETGLNTHTSHQRTKTNGTSSH